MTAQGRPIRWLDRAAALLIAGVAIQPGIFAMQLLLAFLESIPRPGCELTCLLFGTGTSAYLVFVVAILGVAIATWHGHFAGRMLGLVASLVGAALFGMQALTLLERDPIHLADEAASHAVPAGLLGLAAALLLASVGASARHWHRARSA